MLCKARNATLQVNARHIEMAADDQDPKTAMKQLLLPAILSTGWTVVGRLGSWRWRQAGTLKSVWWILCTFCAEGISIFAKVLSDFDAQSACAFEIEPNRTCGPLWGRWIRRVEMGHGGDQGGCSWQHVLHAFLTSCYQLLPILKLMAGRYEEEDRYCHRILIANVASCVTKGHCYWSWERSWTQFLDPGHSRPLSASQAPLGEDKRRWCWGLVALFLEFPGNKLGGLLHVFKDPFEDEKPKEEVGKMNCLLSYPWAAYITFQANWSFAATAVTLFSIRLQMIEDQDESIYIRGQSSWNDKDMI